MAFAITNDREVPKFTLVSKYEIARIGKYPVVRVSFTECVYLTEAPVLVESVADLNTNGQFEQLTIPALAGRTDLVGHSLATDDSVAIGVITAVDTFEVTPAELDPEDNNIILVAAVNSAHVTLAVGTATNYTGVHLAVVERMPVKTTAYRNARSAKQWDIVLHGANPQAMARMSSMLGNVHFAAVKAVLAQLGITTITDQMIGGALAALGAVGTNIDGLLAAEGEKLELDRLNGLLPFGTILGEAPQPE